MAINGVGIPLIFNLKKFDFVREGTLTHITDQSVGNEEKWYE